MALHVASDFSTAGDRLDVLPTFDEPVRAAPAPRSTSGDDDDQQEEDEANGLGSDLDAEEEQDPTLVSPVPRHVQTEPSGSLSTWYSLSPTTSLASGSRDSPWRSPIRPAQI